MRAQCHEKNYDQARLLNPSDIIICLFRLATSLASYRQCVLKNGSEEKGYLNSNWNLKINTRPLSINELFCQSKIGFGPNKQLFFR